MENNTGETLSAVDEWNKELATELLPDTICLAIYLIIGSIGNSVVISVYARRHNLNNEDRFFIPILAIIDLTACIVNCSFSISINSLPVKYNSDFACKFMWFLAVFTTGSSAFTLMLIAIQRYLKLCKPFGKQMTRKWKKIYLAIILGGMVLVALPCFAFYGSAEVKNNDGDIKGLRCTSVTANLPKVALVYKVFMFLLIFGVLVVLIVLYTLIGRVLYRQAKFSWKLNVSKVEATSGTSESGTRETDDDSNASAYKTDQFPDTSRSNMDSQPHGIENKHSKMTDAEIRKHKAPGYRVTLIFMIIAGVFVICFIPKLIMLIWESRKPDFWLTLSPSELGGYRFLYTFYVVNNIINPFLYGFLDKKFQTECKLMFCRK